MKRILAALLLVGLTLGLSPALISGQVIPGKPLTGTTVLGKQLGAVPGPVSDTSYFFADRMKHSRSFASPTTPYAGGSGPALDSVGWPTGDTGWIATTGDQVAISGRYTLYCTGKVDQFTTDQTPSTLRSNTYDTTANASTIVFDVSPANGSGTVYVVLRGTHRTATAAAGTGVTAIKLMPPVTPGALTSYPPTAIYDQRILDIMANFTAGGAPTVIRDLDLCNTNSYPGPLSWSARKLPNWPSQANNDDGSGLDVALEWRIHFANTVGASLWTCIPDVADDTYRINVALTMRWGSDGVNPYTGPPGSTGANPQPATGPVWPGVIRRKIFEHSNEVWNFKFAQYNRTTAKGTATYQATPQTIAWDGNNPGPIYLGYRQYGLDLLHLRTLFGPILGEANFNQDWFIIHGNQSGAGPVLIESVNAITHNDTRPLNQLISFFGGAWYAAWCSADSTATPAQVFAGGIQWITKGTDSERSLPALAGIGGSGYEGNLVQGDGDGQLATTPLTIALDQTPGQSAYMERVILTQFAAGKDILCLFNIGTGVGAYDISVGYIANSPKLQAVRSVAQKIAAGTLVGPSVPPVPVTLPAVDPTVPQLADSGFESAALVYVQGNDFAYRPTDSAWQFTGGSGVSGPRSAFSQNNDNSPEGKQFAFFQGTPGKISQTVTLPAGTYQIAFIACQRGATTFPHQSVQVSIDNTVAATITPPSVDWTAYTTPSVTLAAGPHTISFAGTIGADYTAFVDAVVLRRASIGPIEPAKTPAVTDGLRRLLRLLRFRAA